MKTGFVKLDVTDDAQWEKAVAATVTTLGGYDILINNAGIEITSLVSDVKAEDARRMCDVNIVGTVLGMKHAFRAMRPGGAAGKGGAIVNIASVAATIAFPAIAVYSGTKSAVDRMTRVAAMEAGKLGFGVRVNCIYPGLIPTDMGMQLANDIVQVGLAPDINAAVGSVVEQTPLGRLAEVSDIGDAAVFLCSTMRASSPASACRSTAAWACKRQTQQQAFRRIVNEREEARRRLWRFRLHRPAGLRISARVQHPFIAAGRSAEKLNAAMKSNVAGIETADYEVVEVPHTVAALTELFNGASVVLNTVGPFAKFGREVVQACLAAKCHYTDTTGEQDWLITLEQEYGAKFATAGLLLSPGLAQMYTTGEIAAQLCLETPGLDTLDIAVFWGGSPTIASTQTILVNAAMAKAYYLSRTSTSSISPMPACTTSRSPASTRWRWRCRGAAPRTRCGSSSDPRVANVKVLGGVFNKPLMLGVPQIVAAALEATKDMNPDDRYAALAQTAASVMNTMPPRENPRVNKSVDSVHASGPLGRAHCVIYGNCNYKQTGLLQAYAALSAAAAAEARRLRLGLPGLRPSRVARPVAQLRPGASRS